jgi:hypothetical protein
MQNAASQALPEVTMGKLRLQPRCSLFLRQPAAEGHPLRLQNGMMRQLMQEMQGPRQMQLSRREMQGLRQSVPMKSWSHFKHNTAMQRPAQGVPLMT